MNRNTDKNRGKQSFIVCPYCEKAHIPTEVRKRFSCPECGQTWAPPQQALTAAYRASIEELSVSLVIPGGERFTLTQLPEVLGRNSSFISLQRNLSVSRSHCIINYDAAKDKFTLTPLSAAGGTFVDGMRLPENVAYPLNPGDSFSLAGVMLSVECALKKEPLAIPEPEIHNAEILYLPESELSYIEQDTEGTLRVNRELTPAALVAIHKNARNGHSVLALNRQNAYLNGEHFVERSLTGGEIINLGGITYTYTAVESALVPTECVAGSEIEVQQIKAGYDDKTVLKDITCRIPSGRLTALLGKSGCGKSTLVKILAGLKAPESGCIKVSGSDEDYCTWIQKHQALVPQFNVAHSELTVRQCVEYAAALRLKKVSASVRSSYVNRALKETGLLHLCEMRVSNLSGGQNKRVNIAVETVGSPLFLILDEPTTGLDYATEKQIMAVLRQMSRQKRTILFVTHSLAALEAVDHVIVLQQGSEGASVVAEGRPEDVRKAIGVENWEELFLNMADKAKDVPPVSTHGAGVRFSGLPALLFRYINQWLSSPFASGGMFLGLPLLLGIMISAAVVYDDKDILLFALVAMFWLGMNQTVREIVKEKDLFLHEHARLVNTANYLASKCIFFGGVTLLQAFMMLIPISLLNFNAADGILDPGRLSCGSGLFPMLWLAGLVGSAAGLAGSSAVAFLRTKGEIAAVLLAVLCTLPQILFSSKVIPDGLAKASCPEHYTSWIAWHEGYAPVAEFCSYFTFSRYLYLPLEADINQKQVAGDVIVKAYTFNVGVLVLALSCLIFLTYVLLEIFAYRARK